MTTMKWVLSILLISAVAVAAVGESISHSMTTMNGVTIETTTRDGVTTTTSSGEPITISSGSLTPGRAGSTYVPSGPMDVASRYFDLTPEQEERRKALTDEYATERRAAVAELNARLDAKYRALVLEILPAEDQKTFLKVLELVDAYKEESKAARAEYQATMKAVGVENGTFISFGSQPQHLVNRTPGLTENERQAVGKVSGEIMSAWNEEISAELEQTYSTRPRMRDREVWREYSKVRREIRDEVYKRHQPEMVEGILSVLSPESASKFRAMLAAAETLDARQTAARDKLQAELETLIGPERAEEQVNAVTKGR